MFGTGLALRRENWLGIALALLVASVTVLPIAFVVVNSFNVARPGQQWTPGVEGWTDVLLGSAKTYSAIFYSFVLSIRAPLGVAAAFIISWLLIRVQIPGRTVIELSLWAAFFLPALPVTLGWVLLLEPNYGLFNAFLQGLPGSPGPLNIYSVYGILWVHMTLSTVPVVTMLLAPAFRAMDASLEEVAQTCGSSTWETFRRITVPILFPAAVTAVLAGFMRSLETFEIEQLLGTPAGIYVYATRIYDLINWQPPLFPQAMALSTVFLGILLTLALLYQRVVASRNYATVTGRGMSTRPLLSGRWRYAASGVLFTYIGVGIVLPLAMLLVGSLMRLFGFFHLEVPYTTDHWTRVFQNVAFARAFMNSLVIGLSVASVGLVVHSILGYVVSRSDLTGRQLIGLLTWLPWSIPGILLGLSLLWLLLTMPVLGLLYGNMGALLFALVLRDLPLGANISRVAFLQVSKELEQASRSCGAGWFTTYRRILLPLIAPMLASLFVIMFIGALRDIGTTILLATPSTRTLSLLMFELSTSGNLESAAVIGLVIAALALSVALMARRVGLTLGVG